MKAKKNAQIARIKFKEEKQSYKIMARDSRYLVCVKPFNAKKTYLYTIVDLDQKIRGADNYHCRFEYDTKEGALEALLELQRNNDKAEYEYDFYISHRNRIELKIDWIKEVPNAIL